MAQTKTIQIKVRFFKNVKKRPTPYLKQYKEDLTPAEAVVEIEKLRESNTEYFEVFDTETKIKSFYEKKNNQKNYTLKNSQL